MTMLAEAPPLDRAHFAMMTGGDMLLQAEIVGLFRGQVAEWRTAMAAPSGEGWAEALHKLKGSARGIGLFPLADACEAAERAGAAHAAAYSAKVVVALEEALAALASY